MKKLIKITALYILYVITASCAKEFSPDFGEVEDQVVINALLNNKGPISASVTKSFPVGFYEDIDVEELTDANVMIYENEIFREEMQYQKSTSDFVGQFITSFSPTPNNNYRIEIVHPSFGTASANDVIPNTVFVTDTQAKFQEENAYDFSFTIQDPVEENYYYLRMYFEGYTIEETTQEKKIIGPIIVEVPEGAVPEAQRYINNGYVFRDEAFNGKPFTIAGIAKAGTASVSFNNTDIDPDNIIVDTSILYIHLENLSADAYKFYSSHALTLDADIDFYTESNAVFSNVKNGIGIFAGINLSKVGIKVE